MHQLNVLILGPNSFTTTLNELKPFLKFNSLTDISDNKHDIILFHSDILNDIKKKNYIINNKSLKVCAFKKKIKNDFDASLELPATLKEINSIIENISAKNVFSKNSSIQLKNYSLNKNEKRLIKSNEFIILTEKEIQLLELLLKKNKPVSKVKILSNVWNYSSSADTHTVETHIYRLRKKIFDKFMDENFILNDKNGYYL